MTRTTGSSSLEELNWPEKKMAQKVQTSFFAVALTRRQDAHPAITLFNSPRRVFVSPMPRSLFFSAVFPAESPQTD